MTVKNQPRITFEPVEPRAGQHAVSDSRKPTRYAVLVDGEVVGEVGSKSRESWDKSRSGRIRTRLRGYERTWEATLPGQGYTKIGSGWTRGRAVEKLLEWKADQP